MTVAELIEKLKDLPPDAEVWMSYWTGMASTVEVETIEVDPEDGSVSLGNTKW